MRRVIALWRECPDVCILMPHFSGLGGLDLAGRFAVFGCAILRA